MTLWDHCFELPPQAPRGRGPIQASVAAGKSSHKLKLGANAPLELYDFPGAYAQRFDGVNKSRRRAAGGDPEDLPGQHANRRDPDAGGGGRSVLVHAASNCRQIVSGHKFTLERHFDGDGSWVVHQVGHTASEAADLPLRRRRVHVSEPLHVLPGRAALSPAPRHSDSDGQGNADRRRRRARGRGDLHRQVRPHQGAVPLGPGGQARHRQLVLDPGREAVGRAALGRVTFPASARR